MSSGRRAFVLLLFFFVAAGARAQEDALHSWLRTHLEAEYGVSGGAWVLGDTERETLNLAQPSSGVAAQEFAAVGMPFSRAVRYTISQPSADPFHRTVRFHTDTAIAVGDALLLVMWLRHTWPSDVVGIAEPVFEQAASPYTKSLQRAFSVPTEWGLYLIPFEAAGSYAAGAARVQINLGHQRQMIELGGLALINYGGAVDDSELPEVRPHQVKYGGHEPEAAWRALAQQRIEKYRKGTLRIRVLDEEGNSLPDAAVHARMTRHAFGFGTAVNTGRMIGSNTHQEYKSRLADLTGDGRTFNMAVLENALKWPPWESNWPVSKSQKVSAVAWLVSKGMDVRGHTLVWPAWEWLPGDLEARKNDPAYIRDRIRAHIREIAGYRGLKGVLRDWDVLNEPAHLTDLRDVFKGTPGYPSGEEAYVEWFQWAREADPEARLFVNDYSIVSSYGAVPRARSDYKAIIRRMIEAGAPLDGIGVQGHMGEPLTPIDTVYKVLDELASFGTVLSVTEYDAANVEESTAGDYLRDFLTIVFSHPAVESFLMWGFWDGSHWLNDAPIFREDWSLKPSGEAFLRLVFDEWWTEEEGTAGTEGRYDVRAFAGLYDVSATIGGMASTVQAELSGGDTTDVVIRLTATGMESADVYPGFSIEPNYPDPAANTTTIAFTIGTMEDVRLEIFDLLGRRIQTRKLGLKAAGRHELDLDTSEFSSGIYLYRLTAGRRQHSGRMAVQR